LIRHAGPDSTAVPVLPLPVAMVRPSFRTLLMAAVGRAALLLARLNSARQAAIALASVTMGTNPEHRVTPAANPSPENNVAMIRHPRCQVGLDSSPSRDKVRTIFYRWLAYMER